MPANGLKVNHNDFVHLKKSSKIANKIDKSINIFPSFVVLIFSEFIPKFSP